MTVPDGSWLYTRLYEDLKFPSHIVAVKKKTMAFLKGTL